MEEGGTRAVDGCQCRLALRLAGCFVPIFSCFVPDQRKDSAHNISDDELFGLRLGELATDLGHIVEEAIHIMPFGPGNNLQENVCRGDRTRLGAPYLTPFEKTGCVQ